MSASTAAGQRVRPAFLTKRVIGLGALVVLLVAMALSTKVVDTKAAAAGATTQAFSASAWGKANFPKVQDAISQRAVEASPLAAAVAANPSAADKKYGVPAGSAPRCP